MELTAGGALTLLGESIQQLPFDIEVGVSLVTGALLGVGHQLALVLAAASRPIFVEEFVGQSDAREYLECPWRSRTYQCSDLFAAGVFLEWHLAGRASWAGSDRVLEDVLGLVSELRAAAVSLGDSSDQHAWLEQVWPHVDVSLCSGYRLNAAVRCHGKRFRSPGGGRIHVLEEHAAERGCDRRGLLHELALSFHLRLAGRFAAESYCLWWSERRQVGQRRRRRRFV